MPASTHQVLTNYAFTIEVDGLEIATFKEVSGIASEVGVITHQENLKSGLPVQTKEPALTKWPDIVCKRGNVGSHEWWDWIKQVQDGKITQARRNMSVVLHDAEHNEKLRFNFFNAWCSKVSLSALQAGGTDVSVEEATFVHEGMTIG